MQTECPHCHTLFRITDAQLEMAEGMVRCGYCKRVFDALRERDFHKNEDKYTESENSQSKPSRQSGTESHPDQRVFYSNEADDITPDNLGDSVDTKPFSTSSTTLWSLAILLLIAALAAEYLWFNQPQVLQDSRLKPVMDMLCEHTECERLQRRDPSQIEMISRNIYTHPNEKNALMVSTTLVNHASYAQPYPDVQIDFSNVRGELIASRRFLPEEYLPADSEMTDLLESGVPVTFGLEIRDPGNEAITYEFSFH